MLPSAHTALVLRGSPCYLGWEENRVPVFVWLREEIFFVKGLVPDHL